MKLELLNSIWSQVKQSDLLQNFVKELGNYLEKEEGLYQVVEIGSDGAYLQDVRNNQVTKKTDIPKEILDTIGEDTVLRYQNGEYVIDEKLTKKFQDSLVDIEEYQKIQNEFVKQSGIEQIDISTRYTLKEKDTKECILSYNDEKDTITVPNALIPFWAKRGESLYYKNGEFKR